MKKCAARRARRTPVRRWRAFPPRACAGTGQPLQGFARGGLRIARGMRGLGRERGIGPGKARMERPGQSRGRSAGNITGIEPKRDDCADMRQIQVAARLRILDRLRRFVKAKLLPEPDKCKRPIASGVSVRLRTTSSARRPVARRAPTRRRRPRRRRQRPVRRGAPIRVRVVPAYWRRKRRRREKSSTRFRQPGTRDDRSEVAQSAISHAYDPSQRATVSFVKAQDRPEKRIFRPINSTL